MLIFELSVDNAFIVCIQGGFHNFAQGRRDIVKTDLLHCMSFNDTHSRLYEIFLGGSVHKCEFYYVLKNANFLFLLSILIMMKIIMLVRRRRINRRRRRKEE